MGTGRVGAIGREGWEDRKWRWAVKSVGQRGIEVRVGGNGRNEGGGERGSSSGEDKGGATSVRQVPLYIPDGKEEDSTAAAEEV